MRISTAVALICSVALAIPTALPEDKSRLAYKILTSPELKNEYKKTDVGVNSLRELGEKLANDTGHHLPSFMLPSLGDMAEKHGDFRITKSMRAFLLEYEKKKFGARYVCYKLGGRRGNIYLADTDPYDGEEYIYMISTPWKLTYPNQLRKKLTEAGFRVLPDTAEGESCAVYDPLFTTSATGVKRGHVELNWPEEELAPLERIKPWTLAEWGMINMILTETYPVLEIALTVVFSVLGGFLLFYGLFLVYRLVCRKCGWRERKPDYWAWRRKHMKEQMGQNNELTATAATT